jgi:fatty-acyl-CoA synthase
MSAAVTFVKDWIKYNSDRMPDAPALQGLDSGYRATWAQLDDRVGRLAGYLADNIGVDRGSRLVVFADNDPRVFEILFACFRIGAVMVPLNWRLAHPELLAICRDVAGSVILYDARWEQAGAVLADETGIAHRLGWGGQTSAPDYDERIAESEYRPASMTMVEGDLCMLLYTSGTTGLPKGAKYTLGMLLWQAFNTTQVNALAQPNAHQLTATPLFHAGGLNAVANAMLYYGGCVSIISRFDARRVLKLVGDPARGYTHLHCVPTMWQMMRDLPEFETADFSGLRHAHAGGSALPRSLFDAYKERGLVIQHHYGGTEMGPAVCTMPAEHADRKLGSCGLPVPHTTVRIVGEDGQDVPDGTPGEVWVRGPSITPGYWNLTNEESGSFAGEWYRTGDVLWRDEEGFFYFADRVKDMYKSGGENVFCTEVERVIAGAEEVAEAVVIGVKDPLWGEVGRAIVVPEKGADVTVDLLVSYCDGVLARYKIPKSVVLVGNMPRNATGKVDKAAMRRLYGGDLPVLFDARAESTSTP